MTGMTVKSSAPRCGAGAATVATGPSVFGTGKRAFATAGEAGVAGPNWRNAGAATVGTGGDRGLYFVGPSAVTSGTGRKSGHDAKSIFAGAATVGANYIER